MGLDMYLFKDVNKRSEEDIYWRKANAIHNFFIEYGLTGYAFEDTLSLVPRREMERLVEICESLVRLYNDGEVAKAVEKAQEELPTCSGFFFGSTEYDEWYFEDVQFTMDEVKHLLDQNPEIEFFKYVAWY